MTSPIEDRFAKELSGYRSILALADDLFRRNESKIVWDRSRYATRAVTSLYAKARKQADAAELIASRGYGEDALILARSLVNLCIDLGYITADPTQAEARARRWTANGRVVRRKFDKKVGAIPPDENDVNWPAEESLAEEWPRRVEDRAKVAGLEGFYNVVYRHASSSEHSDAWSATSFLEIKTDAVEMRTVPNERCVDLALLTLAHTFGEISRLYGHFYGFDFAGAEHEMEAVVEKSFGKESTAL